MVHGRLLPSPAAPCPPLDSNAPPLEEGWGQADSGRGACRPRFALGCGNIHGGEDAVRGVWTRAEGGKTPGQLAGPDGCGCVLIHRAGPFGRQGGRGRGRKKSGVSG